MTTNEWVGKHYPDWSAGCGTGRWREYTMIGTEIWERSRNGEGPLARKKVADLPAALVRLQLAPLELCGEHGHCEEFSEVDLVVGASDVARIQALYDAAKSAIEDFERAVDDD